VKDQGKFIRQTLMAALLILSAALCAAGQSGTSGKKKTTEQQTNAPKPSKQNTRESATNPAATAVDASASKAASENQTAPAYYSFEFTQPTFLVSRIFIEHDADGHGKVTFERKNSDPLSDPLELSAAATARIKALWDALHFLDSDKSYQTEKDYAHLGTNRLHMKQGTRERTTEFNWTSDRDAFALVNEYKNAANQAMFIFDITLARENQPLEAPKLMTQLDDYIRRSQLSDPQQLVPLLRELSTDERIPLMARNHAGRLLKKIEK
jgi:hypothetical protein